MTVVSDFDARGPAVFDVANRGNDDLVFRAAVRHSRWVRILRILVPSTIALGIAGGVAYNSLHKPLRALAKVPIDIGNLVVSGTKITMQQPRIAGFTTDKRAYELTAQAAARDLLKPDVVELQGLHATMEMQNNVSFETTAHNGLLRHQERTPDAREEHPGHDLVRLSGAAGGSRDRYSRRQDRLRQAGRSEIA